MQVREPEQVRELLLPQARALLARALLAQALQQVQTLEQEQEPPQPWFQASQLEFERTPMAPQEGPATVQKG